MKPEDGPSPAVVAGVLMGMTVVIAAVAGSVTLASSDSLAEPAPTLSVEAGTLPAAGSGGDQALRLTHDAGEPVDVRALAFVVSIDGTGVREEVTGLPAGEDGLDGSNVAGDRFLDESPDGIAGPVTATPTEDDAVWQAGETVVLRIDADAVTLAPGDRVTVRIRHEPSNTVLLERTLVAE